MLRQLLERRALVSLMTAAAIGVCGFSCARSRRYRLVTFAITTVVPPIGLPRVTPTHVEDRLAFAVQAGRL